MGKGFGIPSVISREKITIPDLDLYVKRTEINLREVNLDSELIGNFVEGKLNSDCKTEEKRSNGDKFEYEGNIINGLYNGNGRLSYTYSNGACGCLLGYFVDGQFSRGRHVYISEDGVKIEYEGEFDNKGNLSNGTSKCYSPDGKIEELIGQFNNGSLNGKGIMLITEVDGAKSRYEGNFRESFASGNGKAETYFPDGSKCICIGKFVNGEFKDGNLTCVSSDGTYGEYIGRFENNRPINPYKKIHVVEDGTVVEYYGEWKNELYNGYGELKIRDVDGTTSVAKGNFEDGLKGYKTEITINHVDGRIEIYTGDTNEDGEYTGYGELEVSFPDGSRETYIGEFMNDKKHGEGEITLSNGSIKRGIWENDKLVHKFIFGNFSIRELKQSVIAIIIIAVICGGYYIYNKRFSKADIKTSTQVENKSNDVLKDNNQRNPLLDHIKEASVYNFQLKDINDNKYTIYIYSDDLKKGKASYNGSYDGSAGFAVCAGANEGDTICRGHFKVAYLKNGSNDIKVEDLKNFESNDDIFYFNLNRNLVRTIQNKFAGYPDFLQLGQTLDYDDSSIYLYCIKDEKLQLANVYNAGNTFKGFSTSNGRDAFFKQVTENTFITSVYRNDTVENLGYDINTYQFDNKTCSFTFLNKKHVSREEYKNYYYSDDDIKKSTESEEKNDGVANKGRLELEEVELAGLKLALSKNELFKIKGEVKCINHQTTETYNYKDCTVDLWVDGYFITCITTKDPSVIGPRGIKVGDSIVDVLKKFPNENNPIVNKVKFLYGKEYDYKGEAVYDNNGNLFRLIYVAGTGTSGKILNIDATNGKVTMISISESI